MLHSLFADFDTPGVPGASALLLVDGAPRFAVAYGLADLAAGTPATLATCYRLASVSKQFTAYAAMLLAERGVLHVDDPLARFFDGAPALWHDITIHMLLTHTSGLLDYEDLIAPAVTAQLSTDDVRALVIGRDEGHFAPGSVFRYSNTAYCLLALVVERVAAQPFSAFLHDAIFAPLGMRTAVAHVEGVTVVANRAYGHSSAPGGYIRTDQSLTSATLGDGGIYASVEDLARWDAELAAPRLVSATTLARIHAPAVALPDGSGHYGYGWYLTQRNGERAAYHTGETIGFRAAIVRLLDRRRTAIVLTNRDEATPIEIAWRLVED
jgi:CubicO group peptidase (beta-lactamase class C family)